METLRFVFTSSFYPPYHLGGDANHVKYLAEELAKRGHEVHVLHSLDAYKIKRGRIQAKPSSSSVITHTIETTFSTSAYAAYIFGRSRPVARRFHAIVKEVRPEVVHHHNVSLLGYDILGKQGNYLNMYTAHDYWLICPHGNLLRDGSRVCEEASCILCGLNSKRPPQLWRYQVGFERAIKDIDILICPSNYAKERISRRLGIKAITIPNFVPEPPNSIAFSGHSNFLLFVGLLEGHKGVLQLIDAYTEFGRELDSKLIIVGTGSLRGKIEDSIRKNHVSDRVIQLGWVDRGFLYQLLHDASVLVIPSVWPENAPLVSMEALSVGTPVVGTSRGGLPEIVSKVGEQLVFSWEREADLVRAISFSIDKNDELREKAQLAYREHFSANGYLTSYEEIVRNQSVS